MFNVENEILMAEERIRSYIRETPLEYSIALSLKTQANVFLKYENMQYTGSFKTRGAMNKLLSLTPIQREKGVITASTGNHGAAVAFGLNKLNIKGTVFVPENASPTKIDNMRNYKIPLKFYGTDCVQTEVYAKEYARQENMTYISPYNDLQVIGGQGTIGLELIKQLQSIDAVFVPIGGGGLISGISASLKSVSPHTKIIGCLPENSPVMAQSIQADRIITMETLPTLSDATAGGIEEGSITFELCKQLVDEYILVSEEEIKNSIINLIKMQHILVEGASGVALAALLKNEKKFHRKNVVVILSGANISVQTLKLLLG